VQERALNVPEYIKILLSVIVCAISLNIWTYFEKLESILVIADCVISYLYLHLAWCLTWYLALTSKILISLVHNISKIGVYVYVCACACDMKISKIFIWKVQIIEIQLVCTSHLTLSQDIHDANMCRIRQCYSWYALFVSFKIAITIVLFSWHQTSCISRITTMHFFHIRFFTLRNIIIVHYIPLTIWMR